VRKKQTGGLRIGQEPVPGVKITRCSHADLELVRKMWVDRGGTGTVVSAWSVDNPLLAWRQRKFIRDFKAKTGTDADELRGFHGSPNTNMISIMENGFDTRRRAGQAFGAGEYFAKNPDVSKGYCRDGSYMLICRLCLGTQAQDGELADGDHIWVPTAHYYVIANPEQVVPVYILRWRDATCDPSDLPARRLEDVLAQPQWSSLHSEVARAVPPNRPVEMTAESTDALWIGYLDPKLGDQDLEAALKVFLDPHMPPELKGRWRLQIVRGRYTQAKVRLGGHISRQTVLKLCDVTFLEGGKERTITVDDGHGSPGQKCPRTIAMYCRGRNQRFLDPCWCLHEVRPTELATFELQAIDLAGAKGEEIVSRFMKSAPFHDGQPKVIEINAIENPILATLHDRYKAYLRDKNKEDPKVMELFHGTNNMILDDVYTHGLQPPSDTAPAEDCEVSGGKGLCTTLCNNDCTKCKTRHVWDKCHMFGLGIYLADLAQKSHRYCSQPVPGTDSSRQCFRMVVCSVALGRPVELAGHLNKRDCMHDVFSLRGLWKGDLEALAKPDNAVSCTPNLPIEQHDLLYVKGLQDKSRSGFSVHNSEYISFHPYQCLPRYEVVYEI